MVIAQQQPLTNLDIGGILPLLTTTGSVDPAGVLRQAGMFLLFLFVFDTTYSNIIPSYSSSLHSGFIMAINEINNKNDGIFDDILPNVHVRFGVRDSLHTFQNSVLAAIDLTQNQFLPNGVDAIIGAGDSWVSEALSAILTGTNTPQISYGSGATELSHSNIYPTFLRVYPSDAYQGTAMVQIMGDVMNFKRIILFASTTSLGSDSILGNSLTITTTSSFFSLFRFITFLLWHTFTPPQSS